MTDRNRLIELIGKTFAEEYVKRGLITAEYTADYLLANGGIVHREMDAFEAVDKFRDKLMNKFLSLCDYDDYNEINLLTIGDAIDGVYDRYIEDMAKEREGV